MYECTIKIYYSKFAKDYFFVQWFNAQNKSTEKRFFFYKDRLIFGLDDPVANMSIHHVYYAWGAREKTYTLKRVSFCLVSSSALVHLANFQLNYHKF